MMQIVPRWKVTVVFGPTPETSTPRRLEFWIHETHLGNVLQHVAKMTFTEHGLDSPSCLTISAV